MLDFTLHTSGGLSEYPISHLAFIGSSRCHGPGESMVPAIRSVLLSQFFSAYLISSLSRFLCPCLAYLCANARRERPRNLHSASLELINHGPYEIHNGPSFPPSCIRPNFRVMFFALRYITRDKRVPEID
jgi:hypothetical protein